MRDVTHETYVAGPARGGGGGKTLPGPSLKKAPSMVLHAPIEKKFQQKNAPAEGYYSIFRE